MAKKIRAKEAIILARLLEALVREGIRVDVSVRKVTDREGA